MSDARFPARVVSVLQDAAIVQRDRDGVFTLFDGARNGWPDDTFNDRRAVPVASAASILEFRRNYREASTIASP